MYTGNSRLKEFRSYISSTISISLVLFVVGFITLIILNTNRLTQHIQERIGFTLMLNNNTSESEVLRLQKILLASKYVKSTEYHSKEEAASNLKEELGEDFISTIGSNPLYSSIKVNIHSKYMVDDSLVAIEKAFKKYTEVNDVYYQHDLVHKINDNINKFSIFLFVFTILLLLIFMALINNTIRISIYNQRFIINTMKLIGATHGFIRKPFLQQCTITGIIGSIVSITALTFILASIPSTLEISFKLNTAENTIITFGVILIFGVLISYISAYFAVNKYLRMKYEELFN